MKKEVGGEFPDVLGMLLEDAQSLLQEHGLSVQIHETVSTGREKTEGYFRVIKQQTQGTAVILTVCKVPDAFRI